MIKKIIWIIIIPIILISCSSSRNNNLLDNYSYKSKFNQSEFSLSPREEVPSMDSENYWYFGVWINNKTPSSITIDMKTGMKIFYKVDDNWIETTNHELIYENVWTVPPNSTEASPWTLVFKPSARNENITYRMFLIGQVENDSQDQVVGSMEYVIKNNNLVEINSHSVAVTITDMEDLYSEAVISASQLTLTPSDITPTKDEDGYWLLITAINNYSEANIIVGQKMGLRIFYQDGNEWYETSNHDVTYPNENAIPPRTTSNDSIYAYVRPNIIREDLVLRIFLIGKIEDSTYDRIVGMIEYLIEDNQIVGVNTIE